MRENEQSLYYAGCVYAGPDYVLMCACLCPGDARMLKDVGRALVLHKRTIMPYVVYSRKRKGSSDETEVQQYAGLVGQQCAERILLYRA